ncbi:CLUMA_CG010475, isoform A [Clunio marinus]|uniref:CLUMA_CG010475, isoform A n=1 Tax=Clunio marinus TaxID=568069 RepID=A0A1J1IBZ6_9DIPT|nr:CLUMA_CG010475, isoform A [Clunio marinus]
MMETIGVVLRLIDECGLWKTFSCSETLDNFVRSIIAGQPSRNGGEKRMEWKLNVYKVKEDRKAAYPTLCRI